MIIVRVAAYELIVEIHTDVAYPDALNDVVNRANQSFAEAVKSLAEYKIPIVGADELDDDQLQDDGFDL
jgi:hypothetical protein